MDEALARSNLEIAGQIELTDPAGARWIVSLRRPGEPENVSAAFVGLDLLEITLRRAVRFLRRDRRWEVRLYTDRGPVQRRVMLPDRDAAMAEALETCARVQSGNPTSE